MTYSLGGTPESDRADAFNPQAPAYNPTTGNNGENDEEE